MDSGKSTVESVVNRRSFWGGKKVLITGHTGFKGSWLSIWLASLGAEVHGLALDPLTDPSLFEAGQVSRLLASDGRADIREADATFAVMQKTRPEIVFHLAAQPLVPYSYTEPLETYAVNVMGTAHVLQAVYRVGGVRALVSVTTDKCYENREWVYPYRETDSLGGFDPYSSSKACAELVTAAFRSSFLKASGTAVATARAGNVIGGGDWADKRLFPDCARAYRAGETIKLRAPDSVRPWQHVLEPLAGYLRLAEALHGDVSGQYADAWNFGPENAGTASVRDVIGLVTEIWGLRVEFLEEAKSFHEAGLLQLDSSKARARLGWRPKWSLRQAVETTIDWYEAMYRGADMQKFCLEQIAEYEDTVVA